MKYSTVYNEAMTFVEKGWTQRASARTKEGHTCNPSNKSAVSWCLTGALCAASERLLGPGFLENIMNRLGPNMFSVLWNDDSHRTQEEVVGLLRQSAIIVGDDVVADSRPETRITGGTK